MAISTWPSPTTQRHGVGAAGQWRRDVPAPGRPTRSGRTRLHRGRRLQWRRPSRPGRRQRGQRARSCWATATARSGPRSLTRWGIAPTPSWPATSMATAMLDLAVARDSYGSDGTGSVGVMGNGDGTFQASGHLRAGVGPRRPRGGRLQRRRPSRPGHRKRDSSTVSVLLGNGDGTFSTPGQSATTPTATPLVADVNGDGTDDVLVVDGAGNILFRQGVPGQPGTFEPPVTVNPGDPSRDIAWSRTLDQGPLLASVDAQDDTDLALRLDRREFRPGRFACRPAGSGADHRGRSQRQWLGRPGRPQCRRRHALGLLQ